MRQTILLFYDLRYNVTRKKKLYRESGETPQKIYLKEQSIGAIQSTTMYLHRANLYGHLVQHDQAWNEEHMLLLI